MGLQEQSIAVRFAGGIETKMDSKAVPNVRLLALENGVFTKAISIKKRNGYASRSRAITGSSSMMTGAKNLGVRDDELVALTSQRAYSYQSSGNQWVDVGPAHSIAGSERAAVTTGTQQTMPDHATNGGVTVTAWEDSISGSVKYTIVDATSGAVYKAPTEVAAATQRPRCIAVGESIHVYCVQPSTGHILIVIINPSTPTVASSAAVLVEDIDPTLCQYDACPTSRPGTPALIVWHMTEPSPPARSFRFGYVDVSGVLGSPVTGHPSVLTVAASLADLSPLAIAYQNVDGVGNDVVGIAFVDSSSAGKVWTYTGTVASSFARTNTFNAQYETPSDVRRCALAITGGSVYSAFEEHNAEPSKHRVITNTGVLGTSVDGTAFTIRSVALASRAFAVDGQVFAYFVHDTTYFNVYLGLRLTDARCIARSVVGGATGIPPRQHVSSAHVVSNVVTCVLPRRDRLASENNDKFGETGLRLLTLDFDDDTARQTAQLGRGLYMAGACPQHYDGRKWCEAGFHVGPELLTLNGTSAGAGAFTIGEYEYRGWYECTDAQGEIHRGPVSVGTTVTTIENTTTITLNVPTLRVTDKDNVRICIARCKKNDPTQFFRVTSLDPTTAGAVNGYLANDKTIDVVTFQDEMTDADLAEQEPLYTNGGILSNDPTSLGNHVVAGNNRLFFTDAADPNVVRFSQGLLGGFGAELAPELYWPVDPFGGAIVALAVMDDKVIVLKENAIFSFNGDGPLPNGDVSTAGFAAPRVVTSDVGCSEPTSVVLTPTGIMFKTAKGVYQLDRSLAVSYVGAPVEAYNDQRVRRATIMPGRSQAVFLTDDGSTLLYDFLFGQWSTFTNHEGLDGCVIDGVYHYLRSDSRVFRETIGSYSDDGARIRLRLDTAWLHMLEHLQGFQRFWTALLLGTWGSGHQLGVSYRTDFQEGWSEPYWLDATGEAAGASGWLTGDNAGEIGRESIAGSVYGDGSYGVGPFGGTNPGIYQWRIGLHTEGQSIQLRFEDFERVGLTGATFELTELLVTGGVIAPDVRPHSGARSA